MKEILARSQQYNRVAHTAKVNIAHLKKESKNQKIFDQTRMFQLNYDIEGYVKEVFNEKRKIYVSHQAEHLLRSGKNTTAINGSQYKYQTRE